MNRTETSVKEAFGLKFFLSFVVVNLKSLFIFQHVYSVSPGHTIAWKTFAVSYFSKVSNSQCILPLGLVCIDSDAENFNCIVLLKVL